MNLIKGHFETDKYLFKSSNYECVIFFLWKSNYINVFF